MDTQRKPAFSFLVAPCLVNSLIKSVVYTKLDALTWCTNNAPPRRECSFGQFSK